MPHQMAAESLLKLVSDHKFGFEHDGGCDTPDCGVSLYSLLPVYERLVGRKVTEAERALFR